MDVSDYRNLARRKPIGVQCRQPLNCLMELELIPLGGHLPVANIRFSQLDSATLVAAICFRVIRRSSIALKRVTTSVSPTIQEHAAHGGGAYYSMVVLITLGLTLDMKPRPA